MKSLVIVFIMVAMTVAHPDRERRSVWGVPAAAVVGPQVGPTAVVGPVAGAALVAAPVPAVVTGPVGAVVASGLPGVVVTRPVW